MKDNKVNYLKFLKYMVEYLNNQNPEDNYRFTELSQWYDYMDEPSSARVVYGIITKENPVSEKSFEMLKKYKSGEDIEEAQEYLKNNNIIYCYNVNDHTDILRYYYGRKSKFTSVINKKYSVDINWVKKDFEYIDKELLDNIISSVKNNPRLLRKL